MHEVQVSGRRLQVLHGVLHAEQVPVWLECDFWSQYPALQIKHCPVPMQDEQFPGQVTHDVPFK